MLLLLQGFDYQSWVILPLIIFCSRVIDVTLGTLRHVMIARGYKKLSPLFGFFEALIWIIIGSQIFKNINNVASYFAWAGGFATGTYVGLIIEERLALGIQVVRIITHLDCDEFIEAMKKANHGITIVEGKGAMGAVKMIYSIIRRNSVTEVEELIMKHIPSAFYSIEDVKNANAGVFTRREKKSEAFRRIVAGK